MFLFWLRGQLFIASTILSSTLYLVGEVAVQAAAASDMRLAITPHAL